jgi:hypothetical protein
MASFMLNFVAYFVTNPNSFIFISCIRSFSWRTFYKIWRFLKSPSYLCNYACDGLNFSLSLGLGCDTIRSSLYHIFTLTSILLRGLLMHRLSVLRWHSRKASFITHLFHQYLLFIFVGLSLEFWMLSTVFLNDTLLHISPLKVLHRWLLVKLWCSHRLLRLLIIIFVSFVNLEGLLQIFLSLITVLFIFAMWQWLMITSLRGRSHSKILLKCHTTKLRTTSNRWTRLFSRFANHNLLISNMTNDLTMLLCSYCLLLLLTPVSKRIVHATWCN